MSLFKLLIWSWFKLVLFFCLQLFFIVIKYTITKTYHLGHFKHTVWWHLLHLHCAKVNIIRLLTFHHAEETLFIKQCLSPPTSDTAVLVLVFDTSYKWDHICSFLTGLFQWVMSLIFFDIVDHVRISFFMTENISPRPVVCRCL